ncbi:MAG: NAD(+)/NADH kinase [Acidobacteriia bacterium]|nr:NAD(+)/NADH kinase [Terriglobia bacterium]
MRAAAILGLGCSPKDLKPFQDDKTANKSIDWRIGMPTAADAVDVILLFGGDGTIHRHLSQLVRLGVPVLVVPAGSGNDFARALALRHVRDSLAAWRRFSTAQDNVRTIDLGLITPLESTGTAPAPHDTVHGSRYFCCVAGVGLDGEVARRANRLPRWLRGHGGYVLSLAPAIFRFAALQMKIQTRAQGADGQAPATTGADWIAHSDQPTVLAVFANTSVYGGGMKIAPRARMDDGQLDVCLVTKINKLKLFSLFPTVYFGRHLSMAEVDYFQSAHLRVETDHPLDVYADGEYVCRTPIEVAVQAKALRVVTP